MGWSGLRWRRYAALALSLLLVGPAFVSTSGRVGAVPAADENARQWLETVSTTMGQPGRVFRAQLTIRDRGQAGEVTSRGTVWIDAEQRKSRIEVRRDNNDLILVTVVDNWDVATFDAILNKANTVTVAEDQRANVRNPAYSVLTPSLIAAYQAGQINPDQDVTTTPGEQLGGREVVKLALTLQVSREVPVPPPPDQQGGPQQAQPRTETVTFTHEYTLYIDPARGLPVQESVRTLDARGQEVGVRTVTFDDIALLSRAELPPDLLSTQAVQRMVASIDQQLERARRIGFPLFWLGRELPRAFTDAKGQRQPGLVLNDVQVFDQPNMPRQVVLVYGTRDEPAIPYVILAQQPRSDWENMVQQLPTLRWLQAEGVQRRPVQVPAGGEGTLYILQPPPLPSSGRSGSGGQAPQLPPLLLVQINLGDAVAAITTPWVPNAEGRQANPFVDPTQIAALAGALARLN
jgi:hypothetical protein